MCPLSFTPRRILAEAAAMFAVFALIGAAMVVL